MRVAVNTVAAADIVVGFDSYCGGGCAVDIAVGADIVEAHSSIDLYR